MDSPGPVEVKLLSANAKLPQRMSGGAAGYDLFAAEDAVVKYGVVSTIRTDFAIAIPLGAYGQIVARSSMAAQGIQVMGGVIDSDYRNPVYVMLMMLRPAAEKYEIKKGDRIAQMIIIPCLGGFMHFSPVSELPPTNRLGGFGSTGK